MLGVGRSAVVEATRELCQADAGLFERITHGGRANRTAYLPRWDRFNAIVDDWDLRMKEGSPPGMCRKSGRSCAGNPAVDRPEIRQQTDRSNRQKKQTVQVERSETAKVGVLRHGQNRLGKEKAGHDGQPYLLHAIKGGKAASGWDASEASAERKRTRRIQACRTADERFSAWLSEMGEQIQTTGMPCPVRAGPSGGQN
jgi:hypothetical protein